jgi:hypothetical protein
MATTVKYDTFSQHLGHKVLEARSLPNNALSVDITSLQEPAQRNVRVKRSVPWLGISRTNPLRSSTVREDTIQTDYYQSRFISFQYKTRLWQLT